MGNCVERSHEDSAEASFTEGERELALLEEELLEVPLGSEARQAVLAAARRARARASHQACLAHVPLAESDASPGSLFKTPKAAEYAAESATEDLPNLLTSRTRVQSFWSILPEEPDSPKKVSSDLNASQRMLRMSILTLVSSKAKERLPNGHISEWQEQWCTPENVERYLDARDGDVSAASEVLAEALRYREELKEVLSFTRVPMWQTDFRVLARGESGHTCMYFCMKNQVDRPSTQASLESIAAVCEMAVKQLRDGATTFDIVCDCHGLQLSKNLDPRVAIGFANLLKHPFRDRLRLGVVVDPGMAFSALWKIFERALPAKTKGKIVLASKGDAVCKLNQVAGSSVANAVEKVMNGNRGSSMPGPFQRPTELDDDYRC